VAGREDATFPIARRPSAKQVLIAVAIGFVLLFGAGVAFQAATTGTDAVTFRGGRYVEPSPQARIPRVRHVCAVLGDAFLRRRGHGPQRVVDEVRRLGEDRIAVAIGGEVTHLRRP